MSLLSNQSIAYRYRAEHGRQCWAGHIYSPDGYSPPRDGLPFALDNGAYTDFLRERPFDGDRFLRMCDKASRIEWPALWVVVPDAVADRERTLELWHEWAPKLKPYKWPLAFAVQDGMTTDDIPRDARVVFVGGSTAWKLRTLRMWCNSFVRVHIARVNTRERLQVCFDAGAESIDGTGWWHRSALQLGAMDEYMAAMAQGRHPFTGVQLELFQA